MSRPINAAIILGGLAAGTLGCSSGPSGPSLTVTFATTGSPADPDGYFVSIGSHPSAFRRPNASATFEDVSTGAHTILVSGMADNCAVDGENPRTVTVEGIEGAQTTVDIVCAPMRPGAVVAEGIQTIAGGRPTVTLHVRNEGGPGQYRVEFWAVPFSTEKPAKFLYGTPELTIGADYEESVTYQLVTTPATYAVVYTTNDDNVGFSQTDLFYLE